MTRQERIKLYLKHIDDHKMFLANNAQKLEIYEGNLLPHVDAVMRSTVSANYYQKIKDRLVPINVLTRIVDKLSKVYVSEPMRKDENYQDFIDRVQDEAALGMEMALADAYSHLFKGYALEPYLDEGRIQIRVIPYDRFLPLSLDAKAPTKMTDFIKIMGEDLFFGYTNEEFFAFNAKGQELEEYYIENGGINPLGKIPVVYGNRSRQDIVPVEDTDIVQMTKMIPVLLSDLAGAIMFQCFTVIYGIDVKAENLTMSPNAFWSLKSDSKNESAKPSLGTIKPEADIEQVLSYIKQTFAFWLETKGVRIGSMNNIDAGNAASGISKIIDEMDVYEIKRSQILHFKKEERCLWELLKEMNNKIWIADPLYKGTIIGDDFKVSVTFDEPRPEISRDTMVKTIDLEYKGGYLDSLSAIKELYPDLDDKDAKARADALDEVNRRGEHVVEEESEDAVDQNGSEAAKTV
jgi:hypothetical protein